MRNTKLVLVNERGRRVGETHPRAKLTDHEIDLIRELAEDEVDKDGKVTRKGLSYREIAAKFDISRDTAKSIGSYRRRAHTPAKMKRVPIV